MDKELYDKGMKIRREVLGDAYVDNALAKSGPFNDPLQELVTTYCWVFEVSNGKIDAMREYMDSHYTAKLFGMD